MSIEDFVSQPNRDHCTVLHPRCHGNTTWFHLTNSGIPKCLNRMLNSMVRHPHPTYAKIPLEEKELWFRHFAQEFTWEPHLTARVRTAFDAKAGSHYTKQMHEWKEKWLHNEVPKPFLGNPELWAGFGAYWSRDETKADSTIHSTNRNSERKGKGKATHNLGAMSKATRQLQLFHELGHQPSALHLLKDAHTNKHTKEIQDVVAREICEAVDLQAEAFLQSQPLVDGTPACTEVPVEVINNFVLQATPQSRGRIFGLPEEFRSSASSRYSVDEDLRAELAQKTTEMEEMRTQIHTLQENNRDMETRMATRVQEEVQAQIQSQMAAYFAQMSQSQPPPAP
ncbi:putative transposase-like protein [Cardamine amara subsp. amara]|uniref:Transposase-like protein n=1 Tax=Cardamine amara subsp. amara TaxID=228776 RepID=A0ABD1C6J8_CARAN